MDERTRNRHAQARYQRLSTDEPLVGEGRQPSKAVKTKIDRVLERIRLGESDTSALQNEGYKTRNTLEQWKRRYAGVAAELAKAQAIRARSFVAPQVPYDDQFVADYFGFDTPAHLGLIRREIVALEAEAKKDKQPKAILILSHPDSAKSTEVENYLSHRIATDPNVRTLLISKTQGAARKRTGRIQRRMTDKARYEDFIDTFGPFTSDTRLDARPWRSDYFTVVFQNSGERDYTLEALGIGGQIYGTRAEVIVLDDIADLGNQTPAEIDKQLEYIQVEVMSRLVQEGILIVIGTHMRERDVYIRLEELGIFDKIVRLPAVTTDKEGVDHPLWPERYPMKRLEPIRNRDRRLWELVWQQNPLPLVGSVFTMEMFESCYDEEHYIGRIPENSIVVAGVDPSVQNYTAGVVFALHQTEGGEWYRYLVDVRNEKGLTGEGRDNHKGVVDFIVDLCVDYRVTTLCVEDGAWMSLINNSFTLLSKLYKLNTRHYGIKATEVTTGSEAIRALSGLFNHRLIALPGSPSSKQHLTPMINQFLSWRDEKQHWRKAFDIVKAFRQAEHAVKMVTTAHSEGVKYEGAADTPSWIVDDVA